MTRSRQLPRKGLPPLALQPTRGMMGKVTGPGLWETVVENAERGRVLEMKSVYWENASEAVRHKNDPSLHLSIYFLEANKKGREVRRDMGGL